jgi:predicted O-methyltransferase YrrM
MNIRNLVNSYGKEFVEEVWPSLPNSQYSNFESLVLYCKVRRDNPRVLYEMGTEREGRSTYIIQKALLKNGGDPLHVMFDIPGNTEEAFANLVRKGIYKNIWVVSGNIMDTYQIVKKTVAKDLSSFVFIDADHSETFAKWYLNNVIFDLAKGTTVHIHDVHFLNDKEKPPATELLYLYEKFRDGTLPMDLIFDSSAYQEDEKNKEEWEILKKEYPFIGDFDPTGFPYDCSASYFEKI